jgi:L-cysteine S-thiosulfotransferase
MKFSNKNATLTLSLVAAMTVASSALAAPPPLPKDGSWGPGAGDATFDAMMQSGFQTKGIASVDRLKQDPTQKLCSNPVLAESDKTAALRDKLQAENAATIKYPADGKYLGDWKNGEKIAQSGRGLTWTDKADTVNGGNCYNCHQITKQELSYGTIGPSLYHYGKLRGNSEEVIKYTWGKIYNAKATNLCSLMPRAGAMGILSEAQIRDLMALLLDPESPVNQ